MKILAAICEKNVTACQICSIAGPTGGDGERAVNARGCI
jgi:hypothetical protein